MEEDDGQRRSGRPSFADSVYDKKGEATDRSDDQEYSGSSLAQRRSAVLFKLKQLKVGKISKTVPSSRNDGAGTAASHTTTTSNLISDIHHAPPENVDTNDHDLDFTYGDCDSLNAELAELYSYSELDDFAKNVQCWKDYAEKILLSIEPPYNFANLSLSRKQLIILDLCNELDNAIDSLRLRSCRILLYLLQGAYVDFSAEEEMDAGGAPQLTPENKGTGGFESACLVNAFHNAHLIYAAGAYQALCSMLMTELSTPFDFGYSMDERDSKASSRDSRHASNADLSDYADRKVRRAATLADNEEIRTVLACLYHMVELIRNKEYTDSESFIELRQKMLVTQKEGKSFYRSLDPLDFAGQPLIHVLFETMPPFYKGTAPHLPMKKVLLLVWKILLATLGGWDELDAAKRKKRQALGLSTMENTMKVACSMSATVICDSETGAVQMAAKRTGNARMIARQLACGGSGEENNDDEMNDDSSPDALNLGQPSEVERNLQGMPSNSRQSCGGDQTPRAGSPAPFPRRKKLPWLCKTSKHEVETFIQVARQKKFEYTLPGDSTTLFGFRKPFLVSVDMMRKHIYTPIAELQAEEDEQLNRFLFSRKEKYEVNSTERLYQLLLPNLSQYIIALLKVLLAAAPSNKAKSDALNILVDVLTPETDASDVLSNSISLDHSTSNPLEDSVRLAIDINRHKEVMVKAASSILILLCKHFKLNHVYQFEYLCQHVAFGNGIPLLLKFLDQNMTRYTQSRYEIHAYNYPQAVLHYVRNREEWPVLNPDNVEDCCGNDGVYCMWRNVFSSINMIRMLNKLVKGKQSRVMMLMVYKSSPILKRALKIRLGIFQLYVLKTLKMQSRYLGRPWRRSNMDIISAIYSKVRHRMTDDWAFANEMRKSYDYQNEESDLKAAVERFHSRRYAKYYPQLAIEVNDAPMPGDDYLNRVDLREFEPLDNCAHSLLGRQPELGERFKKNYEKWLEAEVFKRSTDWDKLLINTRGVIPLDDSVDCA